ncbi:recombination protein O N-terminal domain-containing protein [Mycoplasma sp. Ms02]|uniref:recombination protein O N-terminal domain-containing protein n=1 Tax=Mycoplasma sp. Ms02 TaxID=353851 RepID=UPI001C8A540E|nr:recombination protein O N-terminal domain-containing protein [Mycoplasma sp. Ms02]QZE12291.1 recombination protein O N-terminal domain-containing protein [Mycoplasma sp. Ms02]
MAETTQKALLIRLERYDNNAHLATFLNENGQFTLYAQGLDKPTSKNRANLQLMSVINLEFFKARLNKKIGKLKKASIEIPVSFSDSQSAKFLKKIQKIALSINNKNSFFDLYCSLISKMSQGKNTEIFLIMLANLIENQGIMPQLYFCGVCKSHNQITDFDFVKKTFLCFLHGKERLDETFLELIYSVFHDYENFYRKSNTRYNQFIYEILSDILKEAGLEFSYK